MVSQGNIKDGKYVMSKREDDLIVLTLENDPTVCDENKKDDQYMKHGREDEPTVDVLTCENDPTVYVPHTGHPDTNKNEVMNSQNEHTVEKVSKEDSKSWLTKYRQIYEKKKIYDNFKFNKQENLNEEVCADKSGKTKIENNEGKKKKENIVKKS
jgi:hypothetical protein